MLWPWAYDSASPPFPLPPLFFFSRLGSINPQRIERIAETLQRTLAAAFVESVRVNDTERLTQCLRTYALIDKASDAEALYRRVVVAPFVTKVWHSRPTGVCSTGV